MRRKRKYILLIVFTIALIAGFLTPRLIAIYTISGGSMRPHIKDGDLVLLETISPVYYYKKGDVISIANNSGNTAIKRLIAKPGDTISYKKGNLYVNNINLLEKYEYMSENISSIKGSAFSDPDIGIEYKVNDLCCYKSSYIVPDSNSFVLGDNIFNSSDSRNVGFISYDKISGRKVFSF